MKVLTNKFKLLGHEIIDDKRTLPSGKYFNYNLILDNEFISLNTIIASC